MLSTPTVLVLSAINVDSCRKIALLERDPRCDADTQPIPVCRPEPKAPEKPSFRAKRQEPIFSFFHFDFDIDILLYHHGCGGCIEASLVMVEVVPDLTVLPRD